MHTKFIRIQHIKLCQSNFQDIHLIYFFLQYSNDVVTHSIRLYYTWTTVNTSYELLCQSQNTETEQSTAEEEGKGTTLMIISELNSDWVFIRFYFMGTFFQPFTNFLNKRTMLIFSLVCKLNLNKLLVSILIANFYERMGWKNCANFLFFIMFSAQMCPLVRLFDVFIRSFWKLNWFQWKSLRLWF